MCSSVEPLRNAGALKPHAGKILPAKKRQRKVGLNRTGLTHPGTETTLTSLSVEIKGLRTFNAYSWSCTFNDRLPFVA